MKTNLLLLDSFRNAEDLISYAFSFSNMFNRKLKIGYVFDFEWMQQSYAVGTAGPLNPGLAAIHNEARMDFDAAAAKIREKTEAYLARNEVRVPLEISVTEINRLDYIKEELKNDTDLIVMLGNNQSYAQATEGFVGYPNFLGHVECPVLIIPEDSRLSEVKNVVYTTDYNPADVAAIKHLVSVLKNGANTQLTILHNEKDPGFEAEQKWEGFQKMVGEEITWPNLEFALETEKDFVKGVEKFTKNTTSDLLAILKEDKGFFEQIFKSNDTKKLIKQTDKPVLVYHE